MPCQRQFNRPNLDRQAMLDKVKAAVEDTDAFAERPLETQYVLNLINNHAYNRVWEKPGRSTLLARINLDDKVSMTTGEFTKAQ